jgi:hypothetical protein
MEAFVVILFVIVAVVGVASIATKQKANTAWREAADQLGLNFKAGELASGPEMFGKMHGCPVRVSTIQHGNTRYTRYEVRYPAPLGFGLEVTGRGSTGHLWKSAGRRRVETGDERFDRAVIARGRRPDEIRDMLSDSRMRLVERLMENLPGAFIDDSQISLEANRIADESAELISTVRQMVGVAQDLSGYHIVQMKSPPAAQPRPALVPGTLEENTARAEEKVQRGDQEYSGPHVELDQLQGLLESYLEEYVETDAALNGTAMAPAEEPVEEPIMTVDSPSLVNVLSIEEVCATLFNPTTPNSDVASLFETEFKGREVDWYGKLVSVAPYPFDRVFGTEPGARATVRIHDFDTPFGRRTVQAVVQLSPEEGRSLRKSVGGEIHFTGVLISCDVFMQNLFVKGGQLRA